MTCRNCGAELNDAFCARCGQGSSTGRFTTRSILGAAVGEFLNVDRGVLHTALAMCTRPGRVARDYVSGRRASYTNPPKYLVIVYVAATAAVFGTGAIWPTIGSDASLFVKLFFGFPVLVVVILVPLLAAASWLLFRRSGLNYAEHVIFHTYVQAHLAAAGIVAVGIGLLLIRIAVTPVPTIYSYALQLGMLSYYLWASVTFFEVRPWIGVLKGLATALFGYGATGALLQLARMLLEA